MIVDHRTIWRTARAYIEAYCNDAPIQAELKAGDCLARGDRDSHLAWMAVLDAIREIRRV